MLQTACQPLVCINVDDIGMCHGANAAFVELSRINRVDSGSLMVPCPWFLEMVDLGHKNQNLNIGIHLTLNAEKPFYRWRPITKAGRSSGLVDGDGFLWPSVQELNQYAVLDAVEAELRAQIDLFKTTGLKASHVDGHMGAVLLPRFYDIYAKLAEEYGIPALFPASIENYGPRHNLGSVEVTFYTDRADALRSKGRAVVDRVLETPWHLRGTAQQRYTELFSRIGPGFNFVALHATSSGEIEYIEHTAQVRIEEYRFLASEEFGNWLGKQRIRRTCIPV